MKKGVVFLAISFATCFWVSLANANFLFNKDLKFGVENDPDVTKLQEFLTDKGIYSGPITGNFFSLTLKAVKQFQTNEGIAPSAGYFGPVTRAKVNNILSAQVQASEQQAISETGTSSPPVAAPKTTNDIVNSLQSQIDLLLKQVSLLQQQLQAQQSSTQVIQNLQTQVQQQTQTVQQQQQVLQQIAQNTQPSATIPIQPPASPSSPATSSSASSSSCPYLTPNSKLAGAWVSHPSPLNVWWHDDCTGNVGIFSSSTPPLTYYYSNDISDPTRTKLWSGNLDNPIIASRYLIANLLYNCLPILGTKGGWVGGHVNSITISTDGTTLFLADSPTLNDLNASSSFQAYLQTYDYTSVGSTLQLPTFPVQCSTVPPTNPSLTGFPTMTSPIEVLR